MRFSDFFVNLGVSLSKAVSATADYSYTNPSLVITEVPELGIVPTTPVPMTLSGDTKGEAKNSTMTKPFYCLLDAEVGYNIPLGDATDLALGLFARYAPVSHKTDNSAGMYTLNSDATYTLSQPSTSLQVEKTGYYEVGVSLGLKFGLGRSHKSPAAPQQTTAPKSDSNYDELASELANVRASQKKTEEELASVRAKQKKAEEELAAMKDSQKRAQDELSSMKSENERARANAGNAQNNAKAAEGNATMGKPVEGILFHFDFNKSKPLYDNTTESKLRDLCTRMQNNPELRVIIVGHTDAVGTKRNNNRMGRRRAKKVKQMMVDFGAPEGNIEIVTRGEREPIDTNETDNGRANNRRVTVEEM
jgi:outer membrane protein OmpA-like peptidoglycan-associated protein